MRVVSVLVALILLCLCGSPALAQIGTSTITGRVTDSTMAVIPGVPVVVSHTETNFTFNATTNSEGIYRVQSLSPGVYRVIFEAPGFKRLVRENVQLQTGDTLAVNGILEIGSLTESVEVSAMTQLLETETSATGDVIAGDTMYDLPMFQRYTNWALTVVPGVMANGNPHPSTPGGWTVAGARDTAIASYEDGTIGNVPLGTDVSKPVLNTVAEVKVLTTALPAEYGHSAGGMISVVKKTGTNQLHGMASMYGRSRKMSHRRYFDKDRTTAPRDGKPNGLGTYFLLPDANVSGPVYIPKLYDGRNKTFFTWGWQRLQEKKSQQRQATAPTQAMKNGDFSFGGAGVPIFDPLSTSQLANGEWTRTPFANNQVPLANFDPVASTVLGMNPWVDPNRPGTVDSSGPNANVLADENSLVIFDDFSQRVDQQFTPNVKLYGSLTINQRFDLGRPTNIRIPDFDGADGSSRFRNQKNFSFGPTWVMSPTMVLDVRAGYMRRRDRRTYPHENKDWGTQLGIPGLSPRVMPALGSGNEFQQDSLYGLTGGSPNRDVWETFSFRGDLTVVRGTHAFKMGYEVLHHRLNSTQTGNPSGLFSFENVTAGLQPSGNFVPRTGNTFAGFLTGSVSSAVFDEEQTTWLPRSSIHSFYFQDDWKLSRNVTLNLGVRYSNESPYTTKYGLQSTFDPLAPDPVTGQTGAITHPTDPLAVRDNNNFQPRLGLAWTVTPKLVFRTGFAVNTVDVDFPARRIQFEEYVAIVNKERPPGDPRPAFQISQGPGPIDYDIRPDGSAAFVGENFSARSADQWDPQMRNPYVMNWHSSLQRELGQHYLLEVLYQGSAGVGLLERWQMNAFPVTLGADDPELQAEAFRVPQNFRPFPHMGNIFARSNFGHSTFHAGTVRVEKRFSKGLLFNTFYTFGKSIDSQSDDNDGTGASPILNRSLEKARSDFDRRHVWVAALVWELPLGRGKRFLNRGGISNKLLGGYDISFVNHIQSGNPLTWGFANSPHDYYPTYIGSRRPDLLKSTPGFRENWGDIGTDRFNRNNTNPVVDINNFAYPGPFRVGTAGRNTTTSVPLRTLSISFQKTTQIGERLTMMIRGDYQNALHTFNFRTPTTNVDFKNPDGFAKISSDQTSTSLGAQPLWHLTLALRF